MAILNRSFLLVLTGFVAGVSAVAAGLALASPGEPPSVASDHAYLVSIDEIRSNFVPGEVIAGEFTRKVIMSNGSSREVTLRPVRRGGEELVELIDRSSHSVNHTYMGPNGTTTNGDLMINVKDMAELDALMKRHQLSKN